MDIGLKDRVVVVTGGSSGIGLAAVKLLVSEGALVGACARDAERLNTAVGHRNDSVLAVGCDVLDQMAVDEFIQRTVSRFGRIDGVVAAAGQGRRGTPLTTSEADWHAELGNKVSATLNPVRAAVVHLSLSDAPRVVTLSSVTAAEPDVQLAASSAGRAAVASLTRTLATELAPQGILVNAVAVGMIDTDRQRAIHRRSGTDISYEQWLSQEVRRRGVLLGRAGTPEEVARQIVGLLSPLTSYTTGSTIDVDGGLRRGT
jgi:NAD(P)-dependent dehydrogenase (short-subunit alcohol dehydrogenase family)